MSSTTSKPRKVQPRRAFGQVRKLPSGRWQARYTGPDLARHSGPTTWLARIDAEAWLIAEQKIIEQAATDPSQPWIPPRIRLEVAKAQAEVEAVKAANATFGVFAESWWEHRELKPTTRQTYRRVLDRFLLPTFGDRPLESITKADVRAWHTVTATDTPTMRAHAYGLLRTILGEAVREDLILVNPCVIRGAGNAKKSRRPNPATLEELAAIVGAMPPERQAMVHIAAWCALRFGELTELRRGDVDLDAGVISVTRAVTRVNGKFIVGTPKSDAGTRTVAIPSHIVPAIQAHLDDHVTRFGDPLLFPGADGDHMAPSTLYGRATTYDEDGNVIRPGNGWYEARRVAGREDLRWHDLRHTGMTMAAQAGATLAELMGRAGHSTSQAALVYQHSTSDRDRLLADRLAAMATGQVG